MPVKDLLFRYTYWYILASRLFGSLDFSSQNIAGDFLEVWYMPENSKTNEKHKKVA